MAAVIVLHPKDTATAYVIDSPSEWQMHRQFEYLSREPGNVPVHRGTNIPKGHTKLYVQGHGACNDVGGKTPQALAAFLDSIGLATSDVTQVSLYACLSGVNPGVGKQGDQNGFDSFAHRLSWSLKAIKPVTVMGVLGNGWFDWQGGKGGSTHKYRTFKSFDPSAAKAFDSFSANLKAAKTAWGTHEVTTSGDLLEKGAEGSAEFAAEYYFQQSRPFEVSALTNVWIYQDNEVRRNYHPLKPGRTAGTGASDKPTLSY